jgi:hypothetical protein
VNWPTVFDGMGALVVNCALDPDQLLHAWPDLTWIAVKVNGTDTADDTETLHCVQTWRRAGLHVGVWVYCYGPPAQDVAQLAAGKVKFGADLAVYDVEREYKTDEGAPASWPNDLTARHAIVMNGLPAAVTSYGAIPGYGKTASSINFQPFVGTAAPIIAQLYDSFGDGAERTYRLDSGLPYPGPYPAAGVNKMWHERRALLPGEAVYRPEGL